MRHNPAELGLSALTIIGIYHILESCNEWLANIAIIPLIIIWLVATFIWMVSNYKGGSMAELVKIPGKLATGRKAYCPDCKKENRIYYAIKGDSFNGKPMPIPKKRYWLLCSQCGCKVGEEAREKFDKAEYLASRL